MVRQKILIVDDEDFIRDIISMTLESEFDTVQAVDGSDGLVKIKTEKPDLVVCDYMMPGLTGLELCRKVRQDPLFLHLPFLMVTGRGETQDKVEGLEAGADDYIVKPFEPTELVARVKMALKRSCRDLDANPLTRLPGNVSIMNEVQSRIMRGDQYAVIYYDLNNFKALNDYYGFKKGDEIILATAKLLIEAVQTLGGEKDFIGHIGGDDYVVITEADKAEAIAAYTCTKFDEIAPSYYNEEDRLRGYIVSRDRQGNEKRFGLVGIAAAIVTTEKRCFAHIGEIAQVGAELKKKAKALEKSAWVKDMRTS
jgi:PleD family two-component response regulator